MNRIHAFFRELLLYGVTKGKLLLPVHFPPRWHFLEGRGCWVWPSGVWEYSRGGDNTVSLRSPATEEEQAGASSTVGGQGRRRVRLVRFQVPLEGEQRAGVGGEG